MGKACKETAGALGNIMTTLYEKYKDIQIMVMGIGDLAYDRSPIQISQFESDVRIAEWLDKIWIEGNGGGNGFESYTAAWYMGLHHTKLDCFDKQGRKGIIITMGDEALNPYLPAWSLKSLTGDNMEKDVETKDLYVEASKKFDIFHIAVNDPGDSYSWHEESIKKSFPTVLGDHFTMSTIDGLGGTICDCINRSSGAKVTDSFVTPMTTETPSAGDGISWPVA